MMHHTPSANRMPVRPARRGGFTLMELMVSLGVMAALITMMTMIFATATKSSSEAQNLAAAHRQFRMAARNLYEDLEYTLPGDTNECFLAIAGRSVNAYDTVAQRSAGEAATPRRADVLALLTNRSFTSFINQDPAILFGNKQLVVYGQADIGEIVVNNNNVTIENITRLEPSTAGGVSELLAAQWHLARRIIGFPAETITAPSTNDGVAEVDFANVTRRFTQPDFLSANADINSQPFAVLKAQGALPRGVFHYAGTNSYYLNYSNKWYYKNQLEQWFVFEDPFWYIYSGVGDSATDPCSGVTYEPHEWERQEEGIGNKDICAPVPSSATDLPPVTDFPANWFFDPNDTTKQRQRSVIDPTPPLGQDRRMAHHFLPGCSEFKVEFTYDDPRELATQYESNTLTILGYEWEKNTTDENYKPLGATDIVPAPMPIRWQEVPAGSIYVWSGVEVEPNLYDDVSSGYKLQNQTVPLRWPRAIRITLRSYGPLGRLERPIEQTIIHTFKDK